MIRRLADPPANWNGRMPAPPPGAAGVNVVDGKLAAYWEDGHAQAMTQAQWTSHVAGASYAPSAEETLRANAAQALDANRTYIGLGSPSAAQTTAQVKALSRQNNGLIRLLLALHDGTD